jgi:hypothetical protein
LLVCNYQVGSKDCLKSNWFSSLSIKLGIKIWGFDNRTRRAMELVDLTRYRHITSSSSIRRRARLRHLISVLYRLCISRSCRKKHSKTNISVRKLCTDEWTQYTVHFPHLLRLSKFALFVLSYLQKKLSYETAVLSVRVFCVGARISTFIQLINSQKTCYKYYDTRGIPNAIHSSFLGS